MDKLSQGMYFKLRIVSLKTHARSKVCWIRAQPFYRVNQICETKVNVFKVPEARFF